MGHVYFVVPDLNYAGHARQVSLLAPGMNRADWAVGIYSLGGDGPFGPPLRAASFAVERQMGPAAPDWRSWFVLRWMFPLPGHGVVHAFGLRVLRRLKLATLGTRLPRIVLSLTGRERLTWLDRRCLRIVSRVVVPHGAAADALTRQGVPGAKITVVPLAVGETPLTPDRNDFCRAHNLSADAKLIMTAGWMNDRESLFGAVWAFEFLRFLDDDVRLVVIGDGPGRERMEANARGLAPHGSRVHFLGAARRTGASRSRGRRRGPAAGRRRERRAGSDVRRSAGRRRQHRGPVGGPPRRRNRPSGAGPQRTRNGGCHPAACTSTRIYSYVWAVLPGRRRS